MGEENVMNEFPRNTAGILYEFNVHTKIKTLSSWASDSKKIDIVMKIASKHFYTTRAGYIQAENIFLRNVISCKLCVHIHLT